MSPTKTMPAPTVAGTEADVTAAWADLERVRGAVLAGDQAVTVRNA
jgi:hypothetical protein